MALTQRDMMTLANGPVLMLACECWKKRHREASGYPGMKDLFASFITAVAHGIVASMAELSKQTVTFEFGDSKRDLRQLCSQIPLHGRVRHTSL